MKIIILAAGFGQRLGKKMSKGLVPLDGEKTFLDWQLQTLRDVHLSDDVVLVAGRDYNEIKSRYQTLCTDIIANDNVEMNNGYSLLLAHSHMEKGFVLINCDVVFDVNIVLDLINSESQNSLVVDESKGEDPEEMKCCAIHGVPYRLKKTLIRGDERNRVGEFAGMCKITHQASIKPLIDILRTRSEKGVAFYWEDALEEHMSSFCYGITPTQGKKWLEVDFPEDLLHAKSLFKFQ